MSKTYVSYSQSAIYVYGQNGSNGTSHFFDSIEAGRGDILSVFGCAPLMPAGAERMCSGTDDWMKRVITVRELQQDVCSCKVDHGYGWSS